MKLSITKKTYVNVSKLQVRAGVLYWEDASVNGVEDENGDLIPCRIGDDWMPIINLETGIIENWDIGKTADIHYKVCDDGNYFLLDKNNLQVAEKEGYVVDCLSIGENGYGDYIIMKVDENGLIEDWWPDLSDWNDEDE